MIAAGANLARMFIRGGEELTHADKSQTPITLICCTLVTPHHEVTARSRCYLVYLPTPSKIVTHVTLLVGVYHGSMAGELRPRPPGFQGPLEKGNLGPHELATSPGTMIG
jgi:hypothetical protein